MSNHVTTWLTAYYDDALSKRRRQQVEAHLAQCSQCRAELESLGALSALLQLSPAPQPVIPPEQFVAQVALRLPRQPQPAFRQRVWRLGWVTLPLLLLAAWIFAQTTFIIFGAIQYGLQLGLGGDKLAGLPPLSGPSGWQIGLSAPAGLSPDGLLTTVLQVLQQGGPIGWETVLSYGLFLVIGLLYWSWLAGWWVYHQHQQRQQALEPIV